MWTKNPQTGYMVERHLWTKNPDEIQNFVFGDVVDLNETFQFSSHGHYFVLPDLKTN